MAGEGGSNPSQLQWAARSPAPKSNEAQLDIQFCVSVCHTVNYVGTLCPEKGASGTFC
jgi:hypothetical protein